MNTRVKVNYTHIGSRLLNSPQPIGKVLIYNNIFKQYTSLDPGDGSHGGWGGGDGW